MSNASFCPICGECISDGDVDEDTGEMHYTPCSCPVAKPTPWIAYARELEELLLVRYAMPADELRQYRESHGVFGVREEPS